MKELCLLLRLIHISFVISTVFNKNISIQNRKHHFFRISHNLSHLFITRHQKWNDFSQTLVTYFPALLRCIDDVSLWMCSNRLKLNTEKTQFTCCGTRSQGRRHRFHGKRLSGYFTSYCHLPWRRRGSRNAVCRSR